MKRMLFSFALIVALFGLMSNSSCESGTQPTTDKIVQAKQEQSMAEAQRQVGMPNIVNFQELRLMKSIYELRDQENYICYAYLCNEMNGTVGQFLGKCIGYGLPYATQFSNSEKYFDDPNGSIEAGSLTMPQCEPNGLYMPTSAEATWLLLIDPRTNQPHPVYVEPKLIISPFPLK